MKAELSNKKCLIHYRLVLTPKFGRGGGGGKKKKKVQKLHFQNLYVNVISLIS